MKSLGKKIPEERLAIFLKLYKEHEFNATAACIAMGMAPRSANAHAHRYVKAVRKSLTMREALDDVGLTPDELAKELLFALKSPIVKWNPAEESWDEFRDGRLIIDTVDRIAKLRNDYPGEPPRTEAITVNVNFDVKV